MIPIPGVASGGIVFSRSADVASGLLGRPRLGELNGMFLLLSGCFYPLLDRWGSRRVENIYMCLCRVLRALPKTCSLVF